MGTLLLSFLAALSSPTADGDEPSEVARITAHLSNVEQALRSRDAAAITDAQRAERTRNLDRLHAYWTRGVFPHNHQFEDRAPFFIDHRGVACAVGQLLIDSGETALAQEIAGKDNNARIKQMRFAALTAWQEQSGLTLEELAWIQPAYGGMNRKLFPPAAFYFAGKDWMQVPPPPAALTSTVVLVAPNHAFAGGQGGVWEWTGALTTKVISAPVETPPSSPPRAPSAAWRQVTPLPAELMVRAGPGKAIFCSFSGAPQLYELSSRGVRKLPMPASMSHAEDSEDPDEIQSLFALGDELWIWSRSQQLFHFANSRWSQVPLPDDGVKLSVDEIWGAEPHDVRFLVGHRQLLRWNGKSLKMERPSPLDETDVFVFGMGGSSLKDVMLTGARKDGRATVFHFDGKTWGETRMTDPNIFLHGVVSTGSNRAVGWRLTSLRVGGPAAELFVFDGKAWQPLTPPVDGKREWVVSALPTGQIFLLSPG